MERDSSLISLVFNIHHFPYQLFSIGDFSIDMIIFENLGMLGQMALIELQYFSLQLVFFFVDQREVIFHELVMFQWVVSSAPRSLVKVFRPLAGQVVLRWA